jgi:hypothetical protein
MNLSLMKSRTPETGDRSGPFGPRGLVLAGLSLHAAALLGFWQLTVFQFALMVVYLPFIFFPALLVIGILGFLFTRSAWRRNSWRFCGLHFFVAVLGLAWVPALLDNWTDRG